MGGGKGTYWGGVSDILVDVTGGEGVEQRRGARLGRRGAEC